MKKMLIFITICFLSFSAVYAGAEEIVIAPTQSPSSPLIFAVVQNKNSGYANLRESVNGKVLNTYDNKTRLIVLDKIYDKNEKTWYHVIVEKDNTEGYIRDYCIKIEDEITIDSTVLLEEDKLEEKEEETEKYTYILNINSGIFHAPSCISVKRMSTSNKSVVTVPRITVTEKWKYRPCKNCKP